MGHYRADMYETEEEWYNRGRVKPMTASEKREWWTKLLDDLKAGSKTKPSK